MNLCQLLGGVNEINIETQLNLKNHSTLSLKACGDLVTIFTSDALQKVLAIFNEKKIKFQVLGNGSNIILPEYSDIPYLKLDFIFNEKIFNETREFYTVPASAKLSQLVTHAINSNLSGWECMAGIPGTVGGAVVMNAGTKLGEIGRLVKCVRVVTESGKFKEYDVTMESFAYRGNNFLEDGDVVYEVKLGHLGQNERVVDIIRNEIRTRKKCQPVHKKTCGSVFKNKIGERTCLAGQYIDIMGFKGFSVGDLEISKLHGNFIINRGDANEHNVRELVEVVQDELKLYFGVLFETEVKL